MSVHIKDITSQVELTGAPGAPPASGADPAKPPSWEQREQFRRLAERERDARCRVCGEGFDG